METADIPTAKVSDWLPEQSNLIRAVVGKLGEEAGELSVACHRASIQGLDGINPDNGKTNRNWIADEIGDVLAMIDHSTSHLNLDWNRINERAARKRAFKGPWFESLR